MKCPHCTIDFHAKEETVYVDRDDDGCWGLRVSRCSSCGKLVIRLVSGSDFYPNLNQFSNELTSRLVRPKVAARGPISTDVPKKYAEDYNEACLVLADSAKASAALSRRCLQLLLRDEAKVKHQDLSNEIQELLDRATLPSHIADSLDAVRIIGNFAAHPIKSKSTGEIVPVEPGEAEWNLDVLTLCDGCHEKTHTIQSHYKGLTLVEKTNLLDRIVGQNVPKQKWGPFLIFHEPKVCEGCVIFHIPSGFWHGFRLSPAEALHALKTKPESKTELLEMILEGASAEFRSRK